MLYHAEQTRDAAIEDKEDIEEKLTQQMTFTDFLQSKIDQLKSLALAAGADASEVNTIVQRQWQTRSS